MKRTTTVAACVLTAIAVFGWCTVGNAGTARFYVGTVLGSHAYDVEDSGSQVYFHPQPDTDYYWTNPDGSPMTYNGANRDGMKTYAVTDVGYGCAVGNLKLDFDYYTGIDPTTGWLIPSAPNFGIRLTDGNGNYVNWQVTTGGTAWTTNPVSGEPGWMHWTLDCTTLSDNTWGKVGSIVGTPPECSTNSDGTSTNRPYWHDLRDWTVTGFYDADVTPGFPNEIAMLDASLLNRCGIVFFYGDTVGSMNGDGTNTDIGLAAERAYGQAGRMIKDLTVTTAVDGVTTPYSATFTSAVPEPGTLAMLAAALVSLLAYPRKQRG
ncbi:MAG: PEP-CTERM sorting domain-containing protein [Thermoguttaceae bacterium]